MNRILLVEDDVDVRFIIEHTLIDSGYRVDTTGTVSGASELIRTRRYDLVIADGKLPDGTGMDVADHAIEIGTKAIIITGYAFSMPMGTHDRYEILLKTLRPIEIITAVAQALRD